MKKRALLSAVLLLALAAPAAEAAFVVGGENGWQLSTDGIVDIFGHYRTSTTAPDAATHPLALLGNDDQNFGVTVGLLPSVIAFNIKAPTVNGIESSVRVGIYPSVQNKSQSSRLDVNPNIDFREFYYTAKGKFGEFLAGRALNLYQGKNILTDMTLLTVGVVPGSVGSTTLGHIAYGYLYTNFGPQFRYTTPDMNGVKVALSVGEPYHISADSAKTDVPRIESEVSYATVFGGGNTFQAWASGLFQTDTRSTTTTTTVGGVTTVNPTPRAGGHNKSLGGAGGVEVGFKGVDLLASGYYGEGLGMLSAQDGDLGTRGLTSVDFTGSERTSWGFLAQATYMLTPSVKIGANYGQTRQEKTDSDNISTPFVLKKKQEAAVAMVAYNLNKFTQFIGEYTYAQDTWFDGATNHSNTFSLGTMFYW